MFESVSSVSLEKYPSPNHVLKAIWDPKLLFLSNDDEKLPNYKKTSVIEIIRKLSWKYLASQHIIKILFFF